MAVTVRFASVSSERLMERQAPSLPMMRAFSSRMLWR